MERKTFTSIPLDMDIDQNQKTIRTLSDQGTIGLQILKFPTTETSKDIHEFIVFSREQLDETVVRVKVESEELVKKNAEQHS